MPDPESQGRKILLLLIFLLTSALWTKLLRSENFFFYSYRSDRLNYRNYPLYKTDTGELKVADTPGSRRVTTDTVDLIRPVQQKMPAPTGFIRREKSGDIVIAIRDVEREKYRIVFLDAMDHSLFELRQIQDSLLVVEKYNFLHAGTFRYELYKDEVLVEKNSFTIKNE